MASIPGPSSQESIPPSGKERHVHISPEATVIPSTPRTPGLEPITRPPSVVDGILGREKLKALPQSPSDAAYLEMQPDEKDSVGADLVIVASRRAKQFTHDARMCVLEIIIVALVVVAIAIGVKFGFRSENPNPDPS
jgi:hypothetical protein